MLFVFVLFDFPAPALAPNAQHTPPSSHHASQYPSRHFANKPNWEWRVGMHTAHSMCSISGCETRKAKKKKTEGKETRKGAGEKKHQLFLYKRIFESLLFIVKQTLWLYHMPIVHAMTHCRTMCRFFSFSFSELSLVSVILKNISMLCIYTRHICMKSYDPYVERQSRRENTCRFNTEPETTCTCMVTREIPCAKKHSTEQSPIF